ncbi:MAG TPA: hypothetical protein VMF06_12155 [Candidatus Limnocylindria bacterium]|jgi:hypothetical protein|nr:hypothetical protein [Candidatus Limnocylindria bacterium]
MFMKSTRTLALAVAVVASAMVTVKGGTFSYNDRDILAVFTKVGGPDVAIDLGSAESFSSLASVDFSSTAGFVKYNATTQLKDIFGGSLSGVTFTIFGGQKNSAAVDGVSTAKNTSWLSVANVTGTVTGFNGSNTAGLIANVASSVGYPGGTAGFLKIANDLATDAVSNNGTVLVTQQADPNYTAFGFSSNNKPSSAQHPGIYNYIPGGAGQLQNDAGSTSDFYKFAPGVGSTKGAATFLGTFNLDAASGALTFTSVPEPGDYALVAGGILLAGAILRRRSQNR